MTVIHNIFIFNIKKLFAEKQLEDETAINLFSKKFIVDVRTVKSYVEHLKNLERVKLMRMKHRKKEQKRRVAVAVVYSKDEVGVYLG